MTRSTRLIWGCVVLVAVVLIVSIAAGSVGYLLFALPCVLMMGAMIWMMMRGAGQRPDGGDHSPQ